MCRCCIGRSRTQHRHDRCCRPRGADHRVRAAAGLNSCQAGRAICGFAPLPPTISLEGNAYVNEMHRPDPHAAGAGIGGVAARRPDDGTDAAGSSMQFFAPLKPSDEWPGTRDKDELTAQLLGQLQDGPGVEFNFSQYLQDNVSEAVSGVKGENSIKLYGNDLQAPHADTANKIKSVLGTVQGVTDLRCSPRSASRPSRSTSTAHALRATACRRAISTPPSRSRSAATTPAISMSPAATGISRSSFGWRRNTARAPRRSTICGSAWPGRAARSQIPLSEVASINLISGAAYIYREQQERYLPIKFSVRNAISAARSRKRRERSRPRSSCRRARGSNGSASSAICRMPSAAVRSWCRSASR